MEFLCQDLPQHGIRLVPPSSPEYDSFLADIQRRLAQQKDGIPQPPPQFRPRISEQDRATSAILLNHSSKTIAALQAVWYFETISRQSYRHSRGMLSAQSLLLPFGRPVTKLEGYWHTIH